MSLSFRRRLSVFPSSCHEQLNFLSSFLYLSLLNIIPLKIACYIWFCLLVSVSARCQQFYLRGEVKDESGNPLQNVTILHLRSGFVYKSGSIGSFGIAIGQQVDTFNFSLDGYRPEKVVANADNYLTVQLKEIGR